MMELSDCKPLLKFVLCLLTVCSICPAYAQVQTDTIKTTELQEITIRGTKVLNIERLPAVEGTRIWAGKKNEVISFRSLDANIAEKNARQIFAKVPGVFVYDMDGTGNQINISARGLDPHRGWEFNIRRNDAITNSDMYGYPASHFSMPMEAIERIQLVRGTGSLQYGAQFGGMLNYVSKMGDTTRRFGFESFNSVGSFGLLSTYNAVGGRIGKVDYYVYGNKRVAQGYRNSSESVADAEAARIRYRPNNDLSIALEVSHSKYIHQLAGALNDEQFKQDPRQATRTRNYYSPDIWVPSLEVEWAISQHTSLKWLTSAVLGTRESVMFDRPADVVDVIDPVTLEYAPRQVDIDGYKSYTSELRIRHNYKLFNGISVLAGGIQVMRNDLHRRQQGVGSTGSDYDLELVQPGWGRDLNFKTNNIALFLENKFEVSHALSVSPGIRIERGKSDLTGELNYPSTEIPTTISHEFVLLGVNAQYTLSPYQNIYAGWAQSYRPVILKDIVPASTFEIVDDDLRDADGYNLEIGYRGMSGKLRWDISAFQVRYNNRLGMLVENDNEGNTLSRRTNIGNSETRGLEAFIEYFLPFENLNVSVFSSTAWQDARYRDASIRVGDRNEDISGNKVESVPELISRNGVNVRFSFGSLSLLYSYTGETYADALNTETPPPSGAVGLVPSYALLDLNTTWRLSPALQLRVNVNNLTDKQYFTKRPQFYPGPGIWPSDGRSITVTFGISL